MLSQSRTEHPGDADASFLARSAKHCNVHREEAASMTMDLAKRIPPQDTKYPVIIDEPLAQFIRVAHVLTGPMILKEVVESSERQRSHQDAPNNWPGLPGSFFH